MIKQIIKTLLLIIACLLIAAIWYLTPILKPFPQLSGPHKVGQEVLYFTDQDRAETFSENTSDKRTLETHIYYPADNIEHSQQAPYLGSKMPILQKEFSSLYGIPQSIVKFLFSTIKTNIYLDTTFSTTINKYPVVLFSHGLLGLPSELSQTLLTDLASNGYIVIGINHPYFNTMTFTPDDKIISSRTLESKFKKLSPQEQEDFQTQAIDIYKADIHFLLNQLKVINKDPNNKFYKHIDIDHIGIMGHSAGGTAAIESCRIDQRCKAAINLDGWYDQIIGDEPISQPLLLVFASKSLEVGEPTDEYLKRKNLTRKQYLQREQKIAKHREKLCKNANCSMVIIPNAEHGDFGDNIFLKWPLRAWDAADSYKTIKEINNHIVNFFNTHLK